MVKMRRVGAAGRCQKNSTFGEQKPMSPIFGSVRDEILSIAKGVGTEFFKC